MEAAGAPRLDVERHSSCWSAAQRGALVSVGCRGGTRAGCSSPPHAVAAAEERSARGVLPPVELASNCALGTLAYWALHPTRLETRTKESNMYASRWAANPLRRKETDRWDPSPSPPRAGAPSTDPDLL